MMRVLLYLIGVMLADGGIYRYRAQRGGHQWHTILVCDKDESFVRRITSMAQSMLKVPVSIYKGNGVYRAHIGRKKVYNYFLERGVPPGRKARTVAVPTWIKQRPIADKLATIQGLFDGEGTVYPRGPRRGIFYWSPRITFKVASRPLAEDVSAILRELKINHSKEIVREKGKEYHQVRIFSEAAIRKFKDTIGFRHPERANRLDTCWRKYIQQRAS